VLAAGIGRARLAKAVNALSHAPLLPRLAARAAGLEAREVPLFAGETLQQWWQRRGGAKPGLRGTVLLWPDTFTNHFHPHVGQAAVGILEDAGWTVHIPTEPICCGLTWISTGQLDTAKRMLRRTVDRLADHVRSGGLVLGLEPSCTAVFRSDAPDLFPDDLDIARLKNQTVTLSELLTEHTPGWEPPDLQGVRVVSQVHCHHHAALDDWEADQKLLERAHVEVDRLESGCCGLAGNFGFEKGHLDVSRDCAEAVLLPALRSADPDAVVLADGFSCRTQIHELDSGGREAVHLAELLDRGRRGGPSNVPGDLAPGDRTSEPSRLARIGALSATALAAVAIAVGVTRAIPKRSRVPE
jgi:Fe-S oxidoreductase